jgi:hypothetical protein
MHSTFIKRLMILIMSFSLLSASLPSISYAGMIGTQTLIENLNSNDSRVRVEEFIARENVREQIIALGADPAEVQDRLAALTAGELRLLEQEIDNMPAGGILVVIGIVFVVLIILELTGTIDIFKKV